MKRFLSILLSLIIILSSASLGFNTFSAVEVIEYNYISDYSQFLEFLEKANNTSSKTEYYKLNNDITADATATPIGGYIANKIVFDGDGYTISGLNINGALFAKLDNSQFSNTVFKNTTVNGEKNLAVVAGIAEDNAVISDCVFENCVIVIPTSVTKDTCFGIVAAKSFGTIINCQIDKNCSFTGDSNNIACNIGGVAGFNEGYIAGCSSKVSFDSLANASNSVIGGITGENNIGVYSCVSETDNLNAIGNNTGRDAEFDTVVELKNGKYIVLDEDSSTMDIEYITALLSEAAQNFNDNTAVKEGYPLVKLWTVKNSVPVYATDERCAYVFLIIDKELSGAVIKPSWSSTEISVGKDGIKIPVCAGKADGADFIRNSFEITYKTVKNKMVNNFVLDGVQGYVYSLENIIDDSVNGNYSKMYFAASKAMGESETVNTATVKLYPFNMKLWLTNVAASDELADYCFDGEGTEKNPYKIKVEEELRLLAEYVNSGKSRITPGGELKYNEAYYVLTSDINLSDKEWTPIGDFSKSTDPENAFRGVFDGQTHIVKGMTITKPESYKGLFGFVYGIKNGDKYKNAVIKNINVLDVSISDVNPSGGDVINRGMIKGAVIGNAAYTTISGCVGSGKIEGSSQLAGVVGYAYHCDVNNCGSFADIDTHYDSAWAGGITAYAEYSTVSNCYSDTSFTNYTITNKDVLFTGGISGYVNKAEFEQDYYVYKSNLNTLKYKGTEEKDSSYLKSIEYVNLLNEYAEKNEQDVCWGFVDGYDYPLVITDDMREYQVNCLNTSLGKFSTEKTKYRSGEKVTLNPPTNTSKYPKAIIRDSKGNVLDIVLTDEGNGKISFAMPKKSIKIEPCFDGDYLVGSGSLIDPYLIRNFNELCVMSKLVNTGSSHFSRDSYLVTADIDGGGKTLNSIATKYPFSGNFDGGGHTISNIAVVDGYGSGLYCAFFNEVSEATIVNCLFKNITVEGTKAALLVGISYGVDIKNVTISDCTVNADTIGGGVVLESEKALNIVNCLFTDITVSANYTGALSYENGTMLYVYSVKNTVLSNIKGTNSLVNYHLSSFGYKFDDVYLCNFKVKEISDYNNEVFEVSSSVLNSDDFIAERSSYATNKDLCGWGKDAKGKISLALSDDINGIYSICYDSVLEGVILGTAESEAVPKVAGSNVIISLHYDKRYYAGDVRIIKADGSEVEHLIKSVDDKTGAIEFVMPDCSVTVSNSGQALKPLQPLSGDGISSTPYLVTSAEDLMTIANVINGNITNYYFDDTENKYNNAYFKMTADIDMNGIVWSGIGMNGTEFSGTFNGNYHTISNLNQNAGVADGSRNGLFAIIGSNGKVENLSIKSASIFSESTPVKGSAAIAKVNKGTISKCMVFDSSIQLGDWVNLGGIAGQNDGTIEYCGVVNTGFTRRWGGVSDQTIGGITQVNNGKVSRCYTFKCGFTNGTSQNGAIIASGNAPEYCYYYTTSTVNGAYGTSSTEYDFSCGRNAYCMNNGSSDKIWRQNITYSPYDSYPYPNPSHRIVYRNQYSLHESYTNVAPSYYPGKVYGTHTIMLGDVNTDGGVDESDKKMLIDFLNSKTKLSKVSLTACDVNRDGKITREDLKIIIEHLKSCKIDECDVLGTKVDVSNKIPQYVEVTADGDYTYSGDEKSEVDFVQTGDNTLTANMVNLWWLLIILAGVNMVLFGRRKIVLRK